jgi:hypothetical protein
VLTSHGDLQIVQLHRTDSGTYICIADNGVGSPVSREVNLTVSGKLYFILVIRVVFFKSFACFYRTTYIKCSSFWWSFKTISMLYFGLHTYGRHVTRIIIIIFKTHIISFIANCFFGCCDGGF